MGVVRASCPGRETEKTPMKTCIDPHHIEVIRAVARNLSPRSVMAHRLAMNAISMFPWPTVTDYRGMVAERTVSLEFGAAMRALLNGDPGPLQNRNYGMRHSGRGRFPSIPAIDMILRDNGYFLCPNCDNFEPTDGSIYSNSAGAEICESCAENLVYVDDDAYDADDDRICLARVGRNQQEYILVSDSADIEGCEIYSREWAESNGYHQWEDGIWRDYSEDDDEDGESGEIAGYHSHHLRRNGGYFAESSTANDPALGFEHEVYAKGDLPGAMQDAGLDWILELDGSLDSTHGIEIVSPPRTLATWRKVLPGYHDALKDAGCSAFNRDGDYGIHITVHRRHLSPLQEARIALFLASEENAYFIRAISQRTNIYCGSGTSDIGAMPIACPDKYKEHKKWYRSAPLNLTEHLAEFRVFRSNTKPGRLLKNLEFVHALLKWTNVKSATGSEYRYQPFLSWLKGYAKEYPTLIAYLRDGTYSVRGMGLPLIRDWGI